MPCDIAPEVVKEPPSAMRIPPPSAIMMAGELSPVVETVEFSTFIMARAETAVPAELFPVVTTEESFRLI